VVRKIFYFLGSAAKTKNLNTIIMRILRFDSVQKKISYALLVLLSLALLFSCRKSDNNVEQRPVISYKTKIISVAEDVPMTPVRPDSTGGAITGYSVSPLLPKGITMNKLNGEISGSPSDTLVPTKYIVTATGPGGTGADTITFSVGTVAFNYGANGTFTLEKNSTELSTTPISPLVLAGTFTQFFVSPSPDSLTIKTGLKFNAATGQISGVPTKLTSTNEIPTPAKFTITGISTANKAASTTISIIVNDVKPAFTYTYGGSFSIGTAMGNALSVTKLTSSGSILKYRLSPESAALPAGVTLDSLNGLISGTPTAASNITLVVRGINSGGYQDVNVPLLISANAIAPQVTYLMSLANGNVIDTIAPRFNSGSTIYLTKLPDSYGGVNIFLNAIVTGGQAGTFSATPAFVSGTANEALTINGATGLVSGTPGQFSTNGTPSHAINIANAATGGPAGAYTMNIVANAPFFTYNSLSTSALPNIYTFVQNQKVDVASGNYPGFSATALTPVNGAAVVNYKIIPANSSTVPFANTGLSFNTTTGVISGTPTSNTFNLGNYSFWDYIVQGKKADGSFTLYKIRIKIYATTAEWL
jgi:hypothetical protein